jgi:hypothetical protein
VLIDLSVVDRRPFAFEQNLAIKISRQISLRLTNELREVGPHPYQHLQTFRFYPLSAGNNTFVMPLTPLHNVTGDFNPHCCLKSSFELFLSK